MQVDDTKNIVRRRARRTMPKGIGDKSASTDTSDNKNVTDTFTSSPVRPPRTWKKPPDKPKRPLSAYNLFFRDQREEMLRGIEKPKNPRRSGVGFANMARTIAEKWNNLDSTGRKKYEQQAKEEKRKYYLAVAEWKRSKDRTPATVPAQPPALPANSSRDASAAVGRAPKRRKGSENNAYYAHDYYNQEQQHHHHPYAYSSSNNSSGHNNFHHNPTTTYSKHHFHDGQQHHADHSNGHSHHPQHHSSSSHHHPDNHHLPPRAVNGLYREMWQRRYPPPTISTSSTSTGAHHSVARTLGNGHEWSDQQNGHHQHATPGEPLPVGRQSPSASPTNNDEFIEFLSSVDFSNVKESFKDDK